MEQLIMQLNNIKNCFEFIDKKEQEKKSYNNNLLKLIQLQEKYKKDKWDKIFPIGKTLKTIIISCLCSVLIGYLFGEMIYEIEYYRQLGDKNGYIIYIALIIEIFWILIWLLVRMNYKLQYNKVYNNIIKNERSIQLIENEQYTAYKNSFYLIRFIPQGDRCTDAVREYIRLLECGKANSIYECKQVKKSENKWWTGWEIRAKEWDKKLTGLENTKGSAKFLSEAACGLKRWLEEETNTLERCVDAEGQKKCKRVIRRVKRGIKGEEDLQYKLRKSSMNMYVLFDILVWDTVRDITAEIDCICITPNCIFLIECKNINGNVYEDETGQFHIYYYSNQECSMDSPIIQAEEHLSILNAIMLQKENSTLSLIKNRCKTMVVFANSNKILKVKSKQCVRLEQLNDYLENVNSTTINSFLSDKEMRDIADTFINFDKEARKNKKHSDIGEKIGSEDELLEKEDELNQYEMIVDEFYKSLPENDKQKINNNDWKGKKITDKQLECIRNLIVQNEKQKYIKSLLIDGVTYPINENISMLEGHMLINLLKNCNT